MVENQRQNFWGTFVTCGIFRRTSPSVKRTLLRSVPLVSVLKRFDCNSPFSFCCQLVYPQDLARADAVMVIFLKAKNLSFMSVRSRQRRPSNMCPAICTNWNTNKKYIPTVFLFSFFFLLPQLHLVHFRPLYSRRLPNTTLLATELESELW